MDKELKEQLDRIFDAQVAIYKKLDDLKHDIKGGFRSAPMSSYKTELENEIAKLRRD